MNTLYKNICELIPQGSCLYIATDIKHRHELKVLEDKYTIITLQDVLHLIEANTNIDLYGMIEQVICSRSVKFVGTHLSTFSCYIYRLRGYMSDVVDKNYYINTTNNTINNTNNKKHELGWEYEWTSNYNVWSREFTTGFDLNKL